MFSSEVHALNLHAPQEIGVHPWESPFPPDWVPYDPVLRRPNCKTLCHPGWCWVGWLGKWGHQLHSYRDTPLFPGRASPRWRGAKLGEWPQSRVALLRTGPRVPGGSRLRSQLVWPLSHALACSPGQLGPQGKACSARGPSARTHP